ncbi:hypothetical protein [Dokdonella soli]|uniref:hypothetical protein n=1 Tax=Dokdonella soli TaxID=529810 RepID=UPI0031DC137C
MSAQMLRDRQIRNHTLQSTAFEAVHHVHDAQRIASGVRWLHRSAGKAVEGPAPTS